MPSIVIKNGGKLYPLEYDPEELGATLKLQIYSLTNVPPERQKVLVKGGLLDDALLGLLGLKPNQVVMVMGVPDDKVPTAPAEATVFAEDMGIPETSAGEPAGLVNLGNTCYLNATLQALNASPDVRGAIGAYSGEASPAGQFTSLLGQLFGRMATPGTTVQPLAVLARLRQLHPQFAERSHEGHFKQQDAEEAYTQIMLLVREVVPSVGASHEVRFDVTSTNTGDPSDSSSRVEVAEKLECHITKATNFLRDGIAALLEDSVTKHDASGHDAEYRVTKQLSHLPKHLTVQFVRFFWKRDTQKKSKILRKVQFPMELDVAEFCTPALQAANTAVRDKLTALDKEMGDAWKQFKKTNKEVKAEAAKAKELRAEFDKKAREVVGESDASVNPGTVYELAAVVTHQGASADSGHYQAFVRDDTDLGGERWWRFNDDKVTPVDRERVQALAGGGESDSALMCFYRLKV